MPGTGRIAFIGAGNMTEALVLGLLKGGLATPADLEATDIDPVRCGVMRDRYGIAAGSDNPAAAARAQVLILAVEPQVLDGVLVELAPVVASDTVVVSVAAGYPLARLARALKHVPRLARTMPNTPSSILAGVTAVAVSEGMSRDDARLVRTLFESVGVVVEVDERLLDAVTGLSGSGPAYVYTAIEALADGGVNMGLPRPVAERLAAQTLLGAARMVLEQGDHPGQLKDRVASPGGTTIAGLQAVEAGRLRATLMQAVEAATTRSRELGLGS